MLVSKRSCRAALEHEQADQIIGLRVRIPEKLHEAAKLLCAGVQPPAHPIADRDLSFAFRAEVLAAGIRRGDGFQDFQLVRIQKAQPRALPVMDHIPLRILTRRLFPGS